MLVIKDCENQLLKERKKRTKPFFDNKVQTDLNCYWLYSNLYSSLILEDQNLFKDTINLIKIINEKFKENIFHCYDKNKNEIDVFLEDYVYYSLLLITLYEINNDKESLNKCQKIMEETWNLFYNNVSNYLNRNKVLSINPLDEISYNKLVLNLKNQKKNS